ncbi:E2/UBC family protein [Acidicapsa dinghuensis]|uniref:E2/UBC family protein n=1 Tax=Acidicapsa dinghuensis TaxID=2218256 RepID=A0ABW1EBQ8_9BACT|nr:E2/UBC family protein [Acidicapsa dinghuensis]
MLPQSDIDALTARSLEHAVSTAGGITCIVIRNYPIPPGLNCRVADLLLRLSAGYPDVPPDMWWFSPAIGRPDGRLIAATQQIESHLGRQWQRWSRHLPAGAWKSGIDSLESYLALVKRELESAANLRAA